MRLTNISRLITLILTLSIAGISFAQGDDPTWNKEKAGEYLDSRAKQWFAWESAIRGAGQTKTSCLCCHTLVPYALARPVLRRLTGAQEPSPQETQLVKQTRLRVENWKNIDSDALELLYDFNDEKKRESRGTELILNAVVLAFDDRYQGKSEPDAVTKQAFVELWKAQAVEGSETGSWDWLAFKLEPWESKNARYFGAALAAVAVGTAPGYYSVGGDATTDSHVGKLKDYLRAGFQNQHSYNRTWALYASARINGILSAEEKKQVIDELFAKQKEDGGWSLPSLGNYVRVDGTPQRIEADSYATGLILHVLQEAGVQKSDERIAKGIAWLAANQGSSGQWTAYSLNKNRNLESHVGRFMADAATGYAILALSH